MNITISQDGGAIILRIEPDAGDPPVTIGGLAMREGSGAGGTASTPAAISRRSWGNSRPVRLLVLGVVLVGFIQVGMVVSGVSRSPVQPNVAMAPMSLSGGTSSGTKVGHQAVPPVTAIDDALTDGAKPIGTGHRPAIAPGSAAAQARFGLDP
ncbi:hypothetical protein [Acidiphilium sp.]|uniref:hypothetical protein n=1 Tax=Acidiphilium sp. TaxID=527 RepID=UPI003D05FED0